MSLTASQVPDLVNRYIGDLQSSVALTTHNGQRLSPKEDAFINLFIQFEDAAKAAEEAGYSVKDHFKNKPAQYLKRGKQLLAKDYIQDEIAFRVKQMNSAQIADAEEVMMYLTRVMRGEEKDQFGLDTSIADRTSAAKELNRRFKELEDATKTAANAKEVHLVLERR
jgi:phage terminase small subunit